MVKLRWLEVRRIKKIEVIVEGVNLLKKVRQLQVKDDEIVKAVKKMKWEEIKILRNEK